MNDTGDNFVFFPTLLVVKCEIDRKRSKFFGT